MLYLKSVDLRWVNNDTFFVLMNLNVIWHLVPFWQISDLLESD